MKTNYTFILFLLLISLLCLSAESFGQCELKYNYTIKNATTATADGEVTVAFEKGISTPNCLLFTYIENTPTLLTDTQKRIEATTNKVVFYGLAPGRYLVRVNQKGCKAIIIGQDEKITVGTTNAR
jgi:hypothetical protein